MKQTRKIFVALLVLMTILMSLVVVALPASAAGEDTEIAFKLGNDGSASHVDGSSASTTYTETVNGYKLSITNGTKMYPNSRDAKGNGCIKLGTSSAVGGFKFTVPDDVQSVVIEAAKYKSNTSKLKVNSTTYTLTKASANGQYDVITVDTSSNKTVTLTTVSGGVRAMINSITFVIPFAGDADCEHTNTVTIPVDPTCTEAGYSNVECADCGADLGILEGAAALGHIDANGDFKCDRCTNVAAPDAGESLTITEANTLGKLYSHNEFSADKYYVTGVITSITNTTYGNIYIKDENGKTFYIYGLYSSNGSTRYDAMSTKPQVNDEITVYGIIGNYNGSAQMKNAWLDELVVHSHSYNTVKNVVAPTATAQGYTVYSCSCGKTENRDYVDPAITGSGTEADPFVIGTVENFVKFRDSVNAGETTYNAVGVWVTLAADIDLSGYDWSVNIGDDCNTTFDGIFDGKNHVISNIIGAENAGKTDGYVCAGLFGAIYGKAEIKNLIIENITIDAGNYVGNNVGAVVGFVYSGTGVIENVHVIGEINIDGLEIAGVGGIVGYAYGGALTVKDCTVVGNDGSYINGQSYTGGIVGYAGGKITIANCSVENIDVTSEACTGGIAGILLSGGTATANTVKNVDVASTHVNWLGSASAVVGSLTGNITVTDSVIENVTKNGVATNSVIGSTWVDKPTEPVPTIVAVVNGSFYTNLADAFAAAKNGDTIVLNDNIAIDSETFTIADGVSLVVDLNGYKITVTDNKTANYELFYIYGELTVKGGTIELTATNNREWNAMSVIFHNRGGVLNIENGTYVNLGGTDMAYVVDNSGNYYGDATTNIYGGTLTSTYTAIRNRMEQNSHGASGTAILNVFDGTIDGTTSAIWAQAASTSTTAPATGVITINGGNIGKINTARSAGAESMTVINGGTVAGFKGEIGELVVNGGEITGTIEMYTASGDVVDYVVDANGAYVTFQDLLNAGGEIVLTKDVVLYAPVVITGNVTINLNGYTISYTSEVLGESMITNKGTLVITDSAILSRSAGQGKIVYNYAGAADSSYAKGNYAITNSGNLTLNVSLEVIVPNHDGKFSHALYAIQNGGDLTINGGKISNAHNIAVRQWTDGSITVNGGEIIGTRAIWIQLPSSNAAVAPVVDVTINDGTLTALGGESTGDVLAIYSYSYGNDMKNVSLTVNGGTINGDIALTGGSNKTNVESVTINGGNITNLYSYADDAAAAENITINGGVFTYDDAAIYAEDDGFTFVANANGEYTVIESAKAIPSIGANGNWFIGEVDTGVKATGNGIASVEINSDNELVITYTDGSVLNLGNVKGDKGETGAQGPQGETGNGIEKIELLNFELVITYTNGTVVNLGSIKGDKGETGAQGPQGDKGETGNGIEKAEIINDELVLTYTDGTVVNLGNIKGDKGETGNNGVDGDKGETGNGIAKVEIIDNKLVITYTDGTVLDLGNIQGAQGIQGDKGDKGDKGDQGIQGEQGIQGIQGADGNDNNQVVVTAIAIATVSIIFALGVLLFWRVRRRSWWCIH